MPVTPIFGLGTVGVVRDVPDHTLPPEAWTDAKGVRFVDGKAAKSQGYTQVLGTPLAVPTFLLPVEYKGDSFWIYPEVATSAGRVLVTKASTHSDISKTGGYVGANIEEWSGAVFQGTPILNNPNNVPQYWPTIDPAVKLADFPNWISGDRCKYMSIYKNYIITMNLTNGTSAFPHRVKWSDGAAPGTMPVSWDPNNAVFEAGTLDLSDTNSGEIVCGGPFGSYFAIYKKDTTWFMRYIGGSLIMSIEPVLGSSGILAPRAFCNVTLPKQKTDVHFLCNGYDIGMFDGKGFESVVHMKLLRYIFSIMDISNFSKSFCFNNLVKEEASFCFPSSGSIFPNMALVWNYRDNTVELRDWVGIYAATGNIDTSSPSTWTGTGGSWDQQGLAVWNANLRRQVLVADNINTRFLNLDKGFTAAGNTIPSYVERTGIAVIGYDRMGQPKVDFENRKILKRIWPKVTGGAVNVYLGAASKIGAPVVYNPPVVFDPNDGFEYVDPGDLGPPNGRLLAVKFEGIGNDPWVIEGFTLDVELVSGH